MNLQELVKKEGNNKTFNYKGFDCEILRISQLGHLCGYVDLPKSHPLFAIDYDQEKIYSLNVHGGITYAAENGEKWRIGFDCAHAGDLVPGLDRILDYETYRDMNYVEREIKKLVDQIKKG